MHPRNKPQDLTADDVVAYLTKASPEERWSILERVALATTTTGDTAPPPTTARRPLELVDQTREDESAPAPMVAPAPVAAPIEPAPTLIVEAEPPPASSTTMPGTAESAPPTESVAPPTLPSSGPPSALAPSAPPPAAVPPSAIAPSAPPQSSMQPRASVPDAAEVLFEAMHDLTLLDNPAAGARFCLEAALRAVPCLAGLIHLRDPASLELVVVNTAGPRADTLLGTRTPQADPLIARAARAGRPVIVTYDGIPGAEDGPCARHAFFDPWSAAVVPVVQGGQLLGLIEMIDPLDGAPFGDPAQDALAYVAEQLARFLVDHPVAAIPA